MKTIKKIEVGVLAVLLLAGFVPSAKADGVINGSFAIQDYTQTPGSSAWYSTVNNVRLGDHINFYFTYRNDGSDPLQNVQFNINANMNSSQITAQGCIGASNASSQGGNATFNLSGFNGMPVLTYSNATWSKGAGLQPDQYGPQSWSQILDKGVNIGDVQPGENGYVVVSFVVTDPNTNGGNQGSAPLVQTSAASGVYQNNATLNGQVNPNNDSNTYYHFEYGTDPNNLYNRTSEQYLASGNSYLPVNQYVSSLMANSIYYFRAVARNSYGTNYGSVLSFSTNNGGGCYNGNCNGNPPIVNTQQATNVSSYYATMNGQVNPNNDGNTTYWFEYGTSYGNLYNRTASQYIGSGNYSQNVSQYVDSLQTNTTYYFRAVAQNSYGTTYGNVLNFSTNNGGGCYNGNCNNGSGPTIYTDIANVQNNAVTLNGHVNANGVPTTVWFQYGVGQNAMSYTTDYVNVDAGSSYFNFNRVLNNLPAGTLHYFRAVATNSYGTNYGNTLNFTTFGAPYNGYNNAAAPAVLTKAPTVVFQNSAVLAGEVNPRGGVTNFWFEYGPTMNLGLRSVPLPTGSGFTSVPVSFGATGLQPQTTYFYRAVAQNQFGTTQGPILSFTTLRDVPVTTPWAPNVVYRTRTVTVVTSTGTSSEPLTCATITPSFDSTGLVPGKDFAFTVDVKNACAFNWANTQLHVVLPVEVDFKDSSSPLFTRSGNGSEIDYNLGTLGPNTDTVITVRGTVHPTAKQGDNLIFTSILTFTDNQNHFQSFTSYYTGVVGAVQSSLLASLLSTLGALFSDWLFWVLILLIILFLVYYFTRKEGGEADVKNIRVVS